MGMHAAHALVSGMGGMRTAGDLVARMQYSKKMRKDEAKKYVADKLGISLEELVDPVTMNELREDLDIGRINEAPGVAKGIDAKFRIAKLLDLKINSVEIFKEKIEKGF
ncbi:MAG: hypothetical protein K9L30_12825 [Desulfobacterales bacterium]|nr:hypothetical protein [Desulfobacterales bacterium]